MASDTLQSPRPRSGPGPWASAYILLIALTMALTGWIALNEGWHRYLPNLQADPSRAHTPAQLEALRESGDAQQLRAFSHELAGLTAVTDERRFLDSRLPEHGLYLAQMPRLNQLLLTSHIFLGVFCMLFGGLQFWPWLRREHMKLHRLIGAVYVVTAPVSVLLSLAYLGLTPPQHLYTHLTGFVALWVFGFGAIASIGLALQALRQRRIHEHMGWMALSFACLLVAPMLRLNWVFTAWAWPHIDQETLNLVTLSFMLPQCLLIGLGLIWANRQPQVRRRPASPMAEGARQLFLAGTPMWWTLALAAVAMVGWAWGTSSMDPASQVALSGLAHPPGASTLMTPALAARESAAWTATPGLGAAFAIALGAALLTGLAQLIAGLKASPDDRSAPGWGRASLTVVLGALVSASICLVVGWRVGLAPDKAWFTGGSFYVVEGVLLTALALVHARRVSSGSAGLQRESLVMLLSLLCAPALAATNLWALSSVSWPTGYVEGGHVHLLATAGGCGLLFLAMLHAVLGQANREHA
jgi:hypothetical protein